MFNDRGIPYDPLHHKVLFPCHGHLFLSDSDHISMDACTVMKREKRHNASEISNEGMQFLAMGHLLNMHSHIFCYFGDRHTSANAAVEAIGCVQLFHVVTSGFVCTVEMSVGSKIHK